MNARASAESCELAPGVVALCNGLLWLERSRALVAADAHLAYEDVIGGALPLWSTAALRAVLLDAVERMQAHEVIFLGDAIHSSAMSDGAARTVGATLEALRASAKVTLIAGNHEGRSRGKNVLGRTVEHAERDGWLLLHGDRRPQSAGKCIAGHLHPSLPIASGQSVPVFLASSTLIVVPASTPYSRGLNVLAADCARAIAALGATGPVEVVASTPQRVYPFGPLAGLRRALAQPQR